MVLEVQRDWNECFSAETVPKQTFLNSVQGFSDVVYLGTHWNSSIKRFHMIKLKNHSWIVLEHQQICLDNQEEVVNAIQMDSPLL